MHDSQLAAEHFVTVEDLERLAIGAGILGTGGGGSPYLAKLRAVQHLKQGARIPIVPLSAVPDDAFVITVGGMGAPTVGVERLPRGDETTLATRAVERCLGRTFTHLIPGEIGGGNAISPLIAAAQMGLPVIDGDGMGRAFPELQMDTFSISGITPTPAAIANYAGHEIVFSHIDDSKTLERYARVATVQMGGSAGLAMPPMSGAQVKAAAIPGTISLSIRIGEAVLSARGGRGDPVQAAIAASGGVRLFGGKITSVERRNEGGFARGLLQIEGTGDDFGRAVSIDFQNENLILRAADGSILAVVPDLICIVDEDTAEPVGTEAIRYGLRVVVIGIAAPHQLRTPAALDVVGPAAFGYPNVSYQPLPGTYGGQQAEVGAARPAER